MRAFMSTTVPQYFCVSANFTRTLQTFCISANFTYTVKVQRHFTKHLPGLYNFDYVERLKICKLVSLELRRIKCDVIMLFKILHGMIHVIYVIMLLLCLML